jgi:hypothetical protein
MSTITVETFWLLTARLKANGWQPGPPPQITEATQAVDRAACRGLNCPGCRKRGMKYHSFHNGPRYAVIAGCSRCGAGEQL